jgi:aspartate-semialdehyde dehydrogenase
VQDANVAGEVETAFAQAGIPVFSNARNHRMGADVPLVVPPVNADHIEIVRKQPTFARGGFIVTNANCSTTGLVIALKPVLDNFGIEFASVVTMQAVSGAGYPGVASLDILDNVSVTGIRLHWRPMKAARECRNQRSNAAVVMVADVVVVVVIVAAAVVVVVIVVNVETTASAHSLAMSCLRRQVVPYISGEEDKLQVEYKKIMGGVSTAGPDYFKLLTFPISAHANRCEHTTVLGSRLSSLFVSNPLIFLHVVAEVVVVGTSCRCVSTRYDSPRCM